MAKTKCQSSIRRNTSVQMVRHDYISLQTDVRVNTNGLQHNTARIYSLLNGKYLFIPWSRVLLDSGVPRNFVRGRGFQQIQLRTEDRQNGDLGAVAL